MTLKEMQEKYGIKRIDFEKVKPSGLDSMCASDALVCPYCLQNIEYEAEEIDDLLRGTEYQCPECEKHFYVEAEMSVAAVCTPMEDAVLENRRYIEDNYRHMDECDKRGCTWDSLWGVVEWETFKKYARPLFENKEIDNGQEQ